MSRKPVEQFDHAGLRVSIYQDEDYQNTPEEWSSDSVFLVAEHRQFHVSHQGKRAMTSPCDALAKYECDDEHEHGPGCPHEGHIDPDIERDYHVFLLYAYIHSGVHLTLGCLFEDRESGRWESRGDPGGWDSSTLGLVFAARSEWPDVVEASDAAEALVKEWNDTLSGNVYGYVVERAMRYRHETFNADGSSAHVDEGVEWKTVGSYWGFCGDPAFCTEEAKAAAEAMAKLHVKGERTT